MESSSPIVKIPFATQRWLLTTITRKRARLSRAIASATPGRKCKSSQRVMYSSSVGAFWLITPSRSRNAALFMEYRLFHQLRNDVSDQYVAFLDARGLI